MTRRNGEDFQGRPRYSVPGLTVQDAGAVIELLQQRLHALHDLHLTLKHVHCIVAGPFIAVHGMLDCQVDRLRAVADDVAEHSLPGVECVHATPGVLVVERTWEECRLGRADAVAYLGALDVVYTGVIEDLRTVTKSVGEIDPVTEEKEERGPGHAPSGAARASRSEREFASIITGCRGTCVSRHQPYARNREPP
ncbi:DNA starvation/stationary phase protection protein [Streptomyces sp. NPDC005195]|uniref:DNA starvation/stationary phase protection protein n=1 Tax=Streptomyces sp. NPDC005195 TaxID=3154561 RepID=UPI0033BB1F95